MKVKKYSNKLTLSASECSPGCCHCWWPPRYCWRRWRRRLRMTWEWCCLGRGSSGEVGAWGTGGCRVWRIKVGSEGTLYACILHYLARSPHILYRTATREVSFQTFLEFYFPSLIDIDHHPRQMQPWRCPSIPPSFKKLPPLSVSTYQSFLCVIKFSTIWIFHLNFITFNLNSVS